MSFKKVNPKTSIPELEKEILKFWSSKQIFKKSLEQRKKAPQFTFYDGPPFANGLPHYGHILAMTIKDTVLRFKTMEGFSVPRRGGWDCHGLPVEYELEKQLGISGKPEIEKFGVKKFNEQAKASVFKYRQEWEKTMERMGRWIDWENAYTTMDRDYIESVWWVFKEIYKKGLIYQGYKTLPYCPRCGTPLSNFELNQGYKDNVEDPSVFVKFKSTDEPETYFLAWTTTPWTLPANMALAVREDLQYVKVKVNSENLILSKDRLKVLETDYTIMAEFKGSELVGKTYVPLFDMRPYLPKSEQGKPIYQIFKAPFVTTEDGTGVVHIATAFGEDDLELGKKENIAIFSTVDANGHIIKNLKISGEGKFVKEADKDIIENLKSRNLLFKAGTIRHTYPFCWRCETPLLYYATTTWFIKVSEIRKQLVANNEAIHWMPSHLKHGRFGKWLEEARDWAISRNRYWGAPIPIWQCQNCQKNICLGSLAELEKLSGKDLKNLDLHKPGIDEIELTCSCGGKAKRVPEVLDCWFESGSMPYAQFHYPFANQEVFTQSFPADFIAEGIDQTRGWFYTLHVIASILFDKPAFKNVIVNGIVLAADGKKLSKRLKNYEEPQVIFDKVGVDALRYFLMASTPMGEDYRFSLEAVQNELRKIILPLWNTLLFLATYAEVDHWSPKTEAPPSTNILDQWIASRVNETIVRIKKYFDEYDLTRATRSLEDLITDLSQWYLRRSRKRNDKDNFYQSLYNVLKKISIIAAPFLPFLAENIWQVLRTKADPESVHLCDWPRLRSGSGGPAEAGEIDEEILRNMQKVRNLAEKAHALRAEAGIRLRQPLAELVIDTKLGEEYKRILAEEINVLKITEGSQITLETKITPELEKEGLLRDFIRSIQDLRKKAGLNPADKIHLFYETEDNRLAALIFNSQTRILEATNLARIQKGRDAGIKFEGEYTLGAQKIWLGMR